MQIQLLYDEIQKIIMKFEGCIGIVIKDLKNKQRIAINSREIFDAASIIKLFVLLDLVYRWQEDKIKMDEKVELTKEDIVGGCGILQLMEPGLKLTLHELASLMICISDNTATNLLIERLGIKSINETICRLGLRNTRLNRKLCILIPGLNNYTTAQDTAILLQSFITGKLLSQTGKNYIINLLMKQQLNSKIPDRLLFCPICKQRIEYMVSCPHCQADLRRFDAKGVNFAHKTGEIVGAEHDVGILFLPDRQIVISCFTGDLRNNEEGICFLRNLGILIYEYYRSLGRWG